MFLYHSISHKSALRAFLTLNKTNNNRGALFSAYTLRRNPSLLREITHLPRDTDRIMLDCGSIQALRRDDLSHIRHYNYILYLVRNYTFTDVCQLDIPMYEGTLKNLEMSAEEIRHYNLKMAIELIGMGITQRKVIIIQGRDTDDYLTHISELEITGVFALSPDKVMFGIGGLAFRRKKNFVLEVSQLMREIIPHRFSLHIFGIGSPHLLTELALMGLNSTDTSTPSITSARGLRIEGDYSRTNVNNLNLDRTALTAHNMAMWEALNPFNQ